jgi:hypothetical protein
VKINIFRNPFIDSQVGYLIDSYENGLRKQTESYWRNKLADEILELSPTCKEPMIHIEKKCSCWIGMYEAARVIRSRS